MQHNSWSKGVSLPSVIFVFGNMVYIVWGSSPLTASKVSFGWCLSKQSCSSFILMAERELSVFMLRDWHSSVSAFFGWRRMPSSAPPGEHGAVSPAVCSQGADVCSPHTQMPDCSATPQSHLEILHTDSSVLPLILPYISYGSLSQWKWKGQGALVRRQQCPLLSCPWVTWAKPLDEGEAAVLVPLGRGIFWEVWKGCNWEVSTGSEDSSGQVEGGKCVVLAF